MGVVERTNNDGVDGANDREGDTEGVDLAIAIMCFYNLFLKLLVFNFR